MGGVSKIILTTIFIFSSQISHTPLWRKRQQKKGDDIMKFINWLRELINEKKEFNEAVNYFERQGFWVSTI